MIFKSLVLNANETHTDKQTPLKKLTHSTSISIPFLFPLNTVFWFSDVFRGYRNGTLTLIENNTDFYLQSCLFSEKIA